MLPSFDLLFLCYIAPATCLFNVPIKCLQNVFSSNFFQKFLLCGSLGISLSMGRDAGRGKVVYRWISPDPVKAGPTLRGGVVVVVDCHTPMPNILFLTFLFFLFFFFIFLFFFLCFLLFNSFLFLFFERGEACEWHGEHKLESRIPPDKPLITYPR